MGFIKGLFDFLAPKGEQSGSRNLGRNDRCWCGSGKKYKHCHLQEDEKKPKNYGANCTNA